MIGRLPWKIDEKDPSIIYDADDEIIAENYTFLHIDDFEAIVGLVNGPDEFDDE